jgi:translation initiation factor 2B subunit (eIF-2B alpha/beta/delta family)
VLPRAAVDAAEAALARARVLQGAADDGASRHCAWAEQGVDVVAHCLDVLPPSAVSLIVTNTGVVTPAQGGRVTAELYGDVA